jgi:hypothetical protein
VPDPQSLTPLLSAAAQGLADLSATRASGVVFVREARGLTGPFFEGLEAVAFEAGWAVAEVTLSETMGFDSLASLVRLVAHGLRGSATQRERGLLGVLEAFGREHGRRCREAFEEGADREGLGGDVRALSAAYFAERRGDRAEARRIRAFFDGREDAAFSVSATLGDRNAKRVLAAMTRLVRALGHAGTLIVVRRAGDLAGLSHARREAAYTVIRELADNADGPRGSVACRVVVSGSDALFEGARSLSENVPLALRIAQPEHGSSALAEPTAALLPHATIVDLAHVPALEVAEPRTPSKRAAESLSTIVRLGMGLPPLVEPRELTVGYERVDEAVDKLFEHAQNQGSVFTLLSGEYGSGKTHLLLHLTARALAEHRPVLRLSVERMDADLGNPQRHLRRLLEGAILPGNHAPSPEDRLEAWTRSASGEKRLLRELAALAASATQAGAAAKRALRAMIEADEADESTESEAVAEGEPSPGVRALRAVLLGHDLEEKPSNPNYRLDAYARLLLWIELFERLDGCAGPVVIIDEAENLYRTGTSKPERRTALRSLGFYCGGSLPNACVVLAVTPETLELLREEADVMLDDITEQRTVLACEDVTMLRHRLLRARPLRVASLDRPELEELAQRVRTVHASARGAVRDREWNRWLPEAIAAVESPRELVRAVVARLEARYFVRP